MVVVGLKSILGVKRRSAALDALSQLQELGYVRYTLDAKTKKLTYQLNDWVIKCSGAECLDGVVYTTDGHGFLCLPRNITERLVEQNDIFGEADAWLDLWCHTVFKDAGNAFSYLAPVIQYGKYGADVTLESLGQRWGWEKTKVWRFFRKYRDVFALYRLPGAAGCIVFNGSYPIREEVCLPFQGQVEDIYRDIRMAAGKKEINGNENLRLNGMIAWFSRKVIERNCLYKVESHSGDKPVYSAGHSVYREMLSQCNPSAFSTSARNKQFGPLRLIWRVMIKESSVISTQKKVQCLRFSSIKKYLVNN